MTLELPSFFFLQEKHRRQPAVVSGSHVFLYEELFALVDEFSALLTKSMVPKGAVIGLFGVPSADFLAAFIALARYEAVIVPIEKAEEKQLENRIQQASASWLLSITDEFEVKLNSTSLSPKSLSAYEALNGEAGLVLFSSGTVGQPKAILHALRKLLNGYLESKPKPRNWLLLLLLDHIGGLHTWFSCLAQQACLVIPEHRTPESVARSIEQFQVALLPATPSFLALMLSQEIPKHYSLESLRLITFGTEPMNPALFSAVKKAFPNVRFLQTFGTSETGILKTDFSRDGSLALNIRDAGTAWRIVDGELQLRSPRLSLGYMGHENSRFLEDGWYKTGDMAEVDQLGQIKILGRQASVINVGGLKLMPSEVETVLYQYPGVIYCKVEAEPNMLTGQIVVASLALENQAENPEWKQEIRQFCLSKLEKYKVPVKWRLIHSLPEISNRLKSIK